MISQRARYALKALTALARHAGERPLQAAEIATREDIPKKFLEQILLTLKAAGYVASQRGREGGYVLIRPAAEIPVGAVLRAIDGPIAPLPCLSRTAYRRCPDCPDEGACAVRSAFAEAYDAYVARLEHTSIADSVAHAAGPDPAAAEELSALAAAL